MKKDNQNLDRNVLVSKLEELVREVKEQENPDEMNEYRRLFKRTVPLFLRSYVAGYMLKRLSGGGGAKKASPPKGDFATLFVSVGKNRKVFPKDLKKLFAESLNIAPTAIGSTKVLDSYSFIDIPKPDAQKAIDSLNGKEFRGRTITVNFARKRN